MGQAMKEWIIQFYGEHKWLTIMAAAALVLGILFLCIGFWRTLLLAALVAFGVLIVMLLEMSPESFCPLIRIRIYLLPSPFKRRKVPMLLGAIDACGIMRVSTPSKVVMPCS